MKRSVLVLCLALALLLSGCGGTQPAQAETTPPELTLPSPTPTPTLEPTPTPKPPLTDGELAAFVEEAAEHHGAVGVQAAVIEDGAVTAQAAWGWATLNSDPMTTDHKLRVASLTKVVVGMCAMLLSEDGAVTLDAPIGTWWDTTSVNPWYPDTPVTIGTLLTHTSSLAASDSLSARTYSGARSRISGGGYRAVEPGDPAGWAYNNYGFAVLGMTLELAADTSLDYMLAEGLLDPLGIDAAFEGGSVDNTDLLATLYYYGGSLARSTSEQRSYTLDYAPGHKGNFFDGGFTCSAGDLAKLAAVLANDAGWRRPWTPPCPTAAPPSSSAAPCGTRRSCTAGRGCTTTPARPTASMPCSPTIRTPATGWWCSPPGPTAWWTSTASTRYAAKLPRRSMPPWRRIPD